MFSVGLLYSVCDFLKLIPETGMSPDDFKRHFQYFKYSTSGKILDISFKCGWIKLTKEGIINLTSRGKEIYSVDYQSALLPQLEDIISNFNPVWASLLTKGRSEAMNFLPKDVSQCFKEAGLYDELNESIIKFWDRLAIAYRSNTQRKLLEIGRMGEKLSFEYEWERIGKKPLWQSIESNLAGFDILSEVDTNSRNKLLIEVKATTSEIPFAKIHITSNEWETARISKNFIFHLWHISDESKLYLVSVEEISKHVPTNNSHGQWESVVIPFDSLIKTD